MAEVIGVRFKNMGKVYYFDPEAYELKLGDHVIVETARGVECGEVAMERREIAEDDIIQPLKPLIRIATKDDLKKVAENSIKEKGAFEICQKKIAAHKLEMKLVDVEYTFDNSKILFYFTADGRVDFRELVKDLASVFRTRIELRQIGVRDEAKMLGGLGICGRPFCCASFLSGFQPVSIKMAKEQGLSLNPVKISGTCGRLMCCLKYEQEAYADLLRRTPSVGSIVMTPAGKGIVVDQNILTGKLQVRMDANPEAAPQSFHARQVKLLRGRGGDRREKDEDSAEESSSLEAPADPATGAQVKPEQKLERGDRPERQGRPPEKRAPREQKPAERRVSRTPLNNKDGEHRDRPPKKDAPARPQERREHPVQQRPQQERSSGGAPRGGRPPQPKAPQERAARPRPQQERPASAGSPPARPVERAPKAEPAAAAVKPEDAKPEN